MLLKILILSYNLNKWRRPLKKGGDFHAPLKKWDIKPCLHGHFLAFYFIVKSATITSHMGGILIKENLHFNPPSWRKLAFYFI